MKSADEVPEQVAATSPSSSIDTGPPTDAEGVARIVMRRPLGVRPGFTHWLWTDVAAVGWIGAVASLLTGGTFGYMLALALVATWTSRCLWRQHAEIERLTTASMSPELDERSMGGLVAALQWPNPRVRSVARHRLIHLLASMRSGRSVTLTGVAKAGLYDRLSPAEARRDPALATAILGALPVFGDGRALPYVHRLARMIAWIPRLRVVRRAALDCLEPLERHILAQRIADGSRSPSSLARSAKPADRISNERTDGVLQALNREVRAQPLMRKVFVLLAWMIIAPYAVIMFFVTLFSANWPWSPLFALLAAMVVWLHKHALSARHQSLADELSGLDDVDAVGRLTDALVWPDERMQAVARAALTRLLPHLRASDVGLLDISQRSILNRNLTPAVAATRPEFVISILRAYEQVGNSAAIPCVQALAAARHGSARQNQVRDAAEACLPYLIAIAESNDQAQTLVRPAAAPAADADLLVRPASPSASTDPERLVRPASIGGG